MSSVSQKVSLSVTSLNNNLAVPAVISPVKINAIAKYTAGILPLSGLAWYNTRGKPINVDAIACLLDGGRLFLYSQQSK